jgi:RimJ/RimL family protein N-acetyltransferase
MSRSVAILWSYVVDAKSVDAFEHAYGSDGEWAVLFAKSPDFLGTELFRDADGAYVTIDRWSTAEAYDAFLEQHADEYARIDAECERLTQSERFIGRMVPVARRPQCTLRNVEEDDLPIFFAHQDDAEAASRAAFPRRDRDAFMVHWRTKVLANPSNRTKAIVIGGRVAGNVVSWTDGDKRLVGYWIGREYWGAGVATRALTAFLEHDERTRPLHAWVAEGNAASIRVLEKSGFVRYLIQGAELLYRLE